MRRSIAALFFVAALPLFASDRHYHRNLTINTEDRDELTQCSQIHVLYDGERVPVVEEEVTSVRGLRSLNVRPPQNGGVYVYGSDDATYSAKACKAALEGNAGSVTTTVRGNELSADSAEDVDGVVYFIVRAPRNTTLGIDAHNGPVAVRDFDGTLDAHAKNGPLSLANVSGRINVEAHNGPISFKGRSGTVKLEAYNGPISIRLDGDAWLDGSLDVRAHNGPLTLKVPNGYRSGVVVDSDGHGPVTCRAEGCRETRSRSSWNDDWPRHIELGSGPNAVHLEVGNGPLSIRERD